MAQRGPDAGDRSRIPRRDLVLGAAGISTVFLPSAQSAASDHVPAPGSGTVIEEGGAVSGIRTSFVAGEYVVFATYTSPARVVMLRRSDLARVGAVTLDEGENLCRAAVTDGSNGYFATHTSPAQIVKVALNDLRRIGALTLATGQDAVLAGTSDGTHGYFATYTSPSILVKVHLASLTVTATAQLAVGLVVTAANDGVHGLFGTYEGLGRVVKVRLSDLTQVATVSLGTSDEPAPLMVESIVIHGGFAYCTTNTAPGRIVKLRLDDLDIAAKGTLPSGDSQPGLLGTDGTDLLAGCFLVSGGGRAVRIRMSDLLRLGAVDLAESRLSTGAFDGTHAFFGGDTGPARVVKIAMSGPTRVGGVTLTAPG